MACDVHDIYIHALLLYADENSLNGLHVKFLGLPHARSFLKELVTRPFSRALLSSGGARSRVTLVYPIFVATSTHHCTQVPAVQASLPHRPRSEPRYIAPVCPKRKEYFRRFSLRKRSNFNCTYAEHTQIHAQIPRHTNPHTCTRCHGGSGKSSTSSQEFGSKFCADVITCVPRHVPRHVPRKHT